jgi:hypothetical protein
MIRLYAETDQETRARGRSGEDQNTSGYARRVKLNPPSLRARGDDANRANAHGYGEWVGVRGDACAASQPATWRARACGGRHRGGADVRAL